MRHLKIPLPAPWLMATFASAGAPSPDQQPQGPAPSEQDAPHIP